MASKKGAIITFVSVIVAVIVATATVMSTQASIDYWLDEPQSFSQGLNSITVHCRNGGGMDGDFNLVVTFTNASVSNQTDQPYTKADNSTVKLKFVLHKDDAVEKNVFFTVGDVSGFSVKITLERAGFLQILFLKENSLFPTQLSYSWEPQLGNFTLTAPA